MPQTEEDLAWFRSTFHPIPKPELPDDCVEYSLYVIKPGLDEINDSETRLRLREVQKYASELQKKWLKSYIWQRQGFGLEINKEDGVSLLRGRTEYGDSVEDEWVVVWLLRELSRKFLDVWIKIKDTDGEFLLIEASGTLPQWLEPEVAENRVWINDGALKIIKPAGVARSSRRTTEKLSVLDARTVILKEPKRLVYSTSIEEEAFYRLRSYPAKIEENFHHALLTVPRKVAFLLRQKQAYIAPATEAFYLRDPVALKPLQSPEGEEQLVFPPRDLVTLSVKFPRVCYAQMKSQNFPPPQPWKKWIPQTTELGAFAKAENGMKITCGFEMLLSDSQNQDRAAVREMKMLLEDIDTGDEKLPSDEEMKTWEMKENDDSWLDIKFEDLETELAGKAQAASGKKKADFGDAAAQENLQRIVKQFEDFLNDDKAGVDGAGFYDEDTDDSDNDDDLEGSDEDTGEDKEASFDEDEFTRMMREMMGMPAGVMHEIMKAELPSSRTIERLQRTGGKSSSQVEEIESSDSEVDADDIQTLMQQVEAELNEKGALDLNPKVQKMGFTNSVVQGGQSNSNEALSTKTESDDQDLDDIDANLVRNMLESFKSQTGQAGPSGNMMGMMGLRLPRDEGEGDGNLHDKRK